LSGARDAGSVCVAIGAPLPVCRRPCRGGSLTPRYCARTARRTTVNGLAPASPRLSRLRARACPAVVVVPLAASWSCCLPWGHRVGRIARSLKSYSSRLDCRVDRPHRVAPAVRRRDDVSSLVSASSFSPPFFRSVPYGACIHRTYCRTVRTLVRSPPPSLHTPRAASDPHTRRAVRRPRECLTVLAELGRLRRPG